VERAIRYAEREGLETLTLPLLQKASLEEGLQVQLTEFFVQQSQKGQDFLFKRAAVGGPSPRSLDRNISTLKQTAREIHRWLRQKTNNQSLAQRRLAKMEKRL